LSQDVSNTNSNPDIDTNNDNEYVGLCAEFPSLSWLADTPEKALKGVRKLVADILLDMG
jgi:hypothetical protein